MKFWHHAAGEPWAITESALNTILTIAARQAAPGFLPPSERTLPGALTAAVETVSDRVGSGSEDGYATDIRDGVAIISVVGPLFRYANIFTAMSGASSYELLAKDFVAALNNPDISGIVLVIDSPGGEVNGCAEFANRIFEARGKKPIIAYASGDAASGAYWIASACDEIVVSETALLGSIGVVAVYRGPKNDNAIEIVSSQSPYKRLDPASDEGRSRLQSRIDDLASVFIDSIAKHRGVDPPVVVRDFGGGDLFIGKHAVMQGLADKVGSLEKTLMNIHSIQSPTLQRGSSFIRTGNTVCRDAKDGEARLTHEDSTMTDKNPKTEASELQGLSLESLKAEYPLRVETIQTETIASTSQEAMQQGVQKERERIGAIIASDAARGREQLARHLAFSTDMTVEMALATLGASPIKAEVPAPVSNTGFEHVMASVGNPAIEPDAPEQEGNDVEAIAKRIARFSQGGAA